MRASIADLNATPLIDVLLVLLILLILTLPRKTHETRLDLPAAGPAGKAAEIVRIELDADGALYWNGSLAHSERELDGWLLRAARSEPQPLIQVVPDRRVRYEHVLQLLARVQRRQIERLTIASLQE
ncbi:MAG TPA: biopolymer transporter ExbD [Steroidobacteraceae bacterium]|nr:biopolymer transporter ExbD [Steroidobacteraceae bacterium]